MDNLLLFWDFAAVLAWLGAILLFWSIWSGRARGRKRCPKCRYDMSHPSDEPLRCPECGYEAKHERRLLATKPNRWQFRCAIVMLVLGGMWLAYPRYARHGWMAFMPDTVLLFCMSPNIDSWAARALERRMSTSPFDEDRMWQWQWEVLANQASKAIVVGDDSWFDSPQMRMLQYSPSPFDQAALPYLQDAMTRPTSFNGGSLKRWILRIVSRDRENGLRRKYIEDALAQLPPPDQPASPYLLVRLLQPWPEAELAMPYLLDCLDPNVPAEQRPNRQLVVGYIPAMGPHAREAMDSLFALIVQEDPSAMQWQTLLSGLVTIDPSHPRLHEELERILAWAWEEGDLGEVATNLNAPHAARVYLQLQAIVVWMDLKKDPARVLPLMNEYVRAGTNYIHHFDHHFSTLVPLDHDGAFFLMEVIEITPDDDSYEHVLVNAHVALRQFERLPDDVMERLRRQAESTEFERRALAIETLKHVGEADAADDRP